MALSRIIKPNQFLFKSTKLIPQSSSLLLPCKTLLSPSNQRRPICTKHRNDSFLSPDQISTSNAFVSIILKQPFSPNNPELNNLAPLLTPKVVEAVLNNLRDWRLAHQFFTWASSQHGYKHKIYAYNTMASILSRARKNAPLKALVLDVVNSRCYMNPGALGFLIRCLGSAGLVVEANNLFDQVKRFGLCMPSTYSYSCLLEALCKSRLIDLVEVRLKEMKDLGLEFDKYTLTPVLQVYCISGQFDKALAVFNEMFEEGWVDEHVLSILVVAFSKWGEVDKVMELINRMEERGMNLNEKTFSVLIHGFVGESRMDKALQLFDKIRKLGFCHSISFFDVMIGGLCKNNEREKALLLYSEMKELGINPDFGILMKLITSFSEKEEELDRLLQECWEDVSSQHKNLLYSSVLEGLVRNGSIDTAYDLLHMLMGNNRNSGSILAKYFLNEKEVITLDSNSFTSVINGLLDAGKVDMALTLFREMIQFGFNPTLLLYNGLIDALCKLKRLEESYELLRQMKEMGLEPTNFTHNCIFGCLCQLEDVEEAVDLVKKMRLYGHEPWIKYSTLLVKNLCKHGKVEESCKFITDMSQEGFPPDIITYSAVINGLIQIKSVDTGLELFRDICARGYCPDVISYNILIKAFCKAKRVAEAECLVNDMMLKGLVPSVVTYNYLIDGWCKNGEIDQAILRFSKMFGKERKANVITYVTLVDGLCNFGRTDDALNLWDEMFRKGCIPNRIAYHTLINGLCKCGRSSAALVHFNAMKEKEMKPDNYLYIALIRAFLSDTNLPSVLDILKEMVDVGNLPDPQDKNFPVIKDAICKLSEDARTFSSIRDLIEEGRIPDVSPREGAEGRHNPSI
ncbi:putative pentatricopeptide repeat-containing protein [Hibiscus syriacus]|uniref:Pentatricopeptide repeat-containing protein n=1 Tax=Hibiscus syriacus TaxID=106335 RepID=A0A6A3BIG5_HIBSY|nr:putative pentatricopeptide repeat-containing protein At5g08310, mitochondrial [Hibiscus syriacus]XP_039068737.1 putative pentatricopeptide repeat-containing protein At5g08310, mitochondrial [Hibiscus syriacus]XP_039068738.1 putative pentatricopeptide repeat-containing protein At5g08310, mitochondrial [Hibiscus syriacus]XP_039068739.1 putative pentatricopeptide repeat-containing protein At5g08310, mitochondrial [Hibiscus syriacus]KAE8716830.1 putative pentatricopeptide repeat-containing prote